MKEQYRITGYIDGLMQKSVINPTRSSIGGAVTKQVNSLLYQPLLLSVQDPVVSLWDKNTLNIY